MQTIFTDNSDKLLVFFTDTARSYTPTLAISSQLRDRLQWGDILVMPAQCARKYITYTQGLVVLYFCTSNNFIIKYQLNSEEPLTFLCYHYFTDTPSIQ